MNLENQDTKILSELFPGVILNPLEGKYVLVKKFKNATYYYGETYRIKNYRRPQQPVIYKTSYTNAANAFLFENKVLAEQRLREVNSVRKKLKLSLDKAENHFLVKYIISGVTGSLSLNIKLVSIQNFKNKKENLIENYINTNIHNTEERLRQTRDSLQKLEKNLKFLEKVKDYDFNKLMSAHKTSFQKNIEVLYGSNK
jgi:hypothetical protein